MTEFAAGAPPGGLKFTLPPTQTTTEIVSSATSEEGSAIPPPILFPSAQTGPSVGDLLSRLPPVTTFIGYSPAGIPQFGSQPALTDDEIMSLMALNDDEGQPLWTADDIDALYQFILMVVQMKFTVELIDSNRADKISDDETAPTDEGEDGAASSSEQIPDTTSSDSELPSPVLSDVDRLYQNISTATANKFSDIMSWLTSKPWVISDEAVHESPLLKDNRLRIALKILELEQEPKVEEGNIVCKNQRCRSRRIMRQFVQTRSGDEGFSVFYSCTECGRQF